MADDAMASFQRTDFLNRVTPSITDETPQKKHEKYQEDINDQRNPMLRIRNSLTDANGDENQIAFKKQKMSVATLPNRQGESECREYGYAEDGTPIPGGIAKQT